MSSIFPLRDTVSLDDEREPRLVEIDEDTADEVFEALSSATTRQIFLELHNAPQTASDLADVTETSVQNVQYHLTKLQDADLIEVVDTWYSERGSEMKVYAPQDESLVLFAGRDKQGTLRSLLNRIVGVLALLVPTSVLAGLAAGGGNLGLGGFLGGSSGDAADGADPSAGGNGNGNGNGGDADVGGNGNGGNGAAVEEEAPEEDGLEIQDAEPTNQAAPTDTPTTADTPEPAKTSTEEAGEMSGEATQTPTEEVEDVTFSTTANTTEPQREVAADGGQQMTPQDAVDGAAEATEAAASVDPALAAAVAFFLGGVFVFTALVMWYGTPDTWG